MKRFRLLFVLMGLSFLCLMGLWVIGTVAHIYSMLATISPWIAKGFLALFVSVLVVLLVGLCYYIYLFWRPNNVGKSSALPVPDDPTDAATLTLDAVQQQVNHIQDEIQKAALLRQRNVIQDLMASGDFQVVIFGVGSTGKTSTINAILSRMVSDVAASMGTTTASKAYRLQLQGVGRSVLLTDTPGILDASVWGDERGDEARKLATEADLLLFIVDNDILQTEYDLLRRLVELGKRSLLVFNKVDLYTDDERDQILSHLRHRVHAFLDPDDVIAIAANPVPITLGNGDSFSPMPEILPLLTRIAHILQREGETLMAENLLLQSQRLSDQTRRTLEQEREQEANAIIEKYQWVSGGVISVMPLPGLDFLATAAINTQMVIEIGNVYGCQVNRDRAKTLALSLAKTLGGLGLVKGTFELWRTTLRLNIATVLVGQALQGVTGAYLTRIAGKSFIEYFRQEQDWGDGGITDVVQEQFQLNRRDEFIQSFITQAMTKIVMPLVDAPKAPQSRTPK